MLADMVGAISRPLVSLFREEKSGCGMEPELSELRDDGAEDSSKEHDHLFRLFVGWVPKLFTENDLLPLFQRYGDVKDIIMLKDKMSGQPRGCAFVSYATKEEAEAVIHALDKGVHLPGALCPMEVRFARSHQYIPAGQGPQDNRQLFFARVPLLTTEAQLHELFSKFGEVVEINLFRERRTQLSKGCGFITMATREHAVTAMQALDEKHLLEGSVTPLAVKWADPELQIKKRRAVEDSNADNRMLFFAKVLRSASEDEVRSLFSLYGRVVEVNLFRAFQGAPTTKGCGLVTMGSNDEAAAAIDALDSRHAWDGMEAPMVVKWMDAALQKRRREEHLAAMRQGLVPSMAMTSADAWVSSGSRAGTSGAAAVAAAAAAGSSRSAALSQGKLLDAAAAAAAAAAVGQPGGVTNEMLAAAAAVGGGGGGGVSSGGAGPSEMPPVGCAPDAYKLFVGNIPKGYTEEELRPVFESVGPVVELVVVRDKFTHESKGSAFVWYMARSDADQAVLQFNLCRVLQDPTGEQTRPLVVRRANMRKPATAMMQQQQQHPHSHAMINSGGTVLTSGPSSGTAGGGGLSVSRSMGGGVMDLTAMTGSMGLGGAAEVPLHLQPMAAMQVQQQQQQQQQQQDFRGAVAFYQTTGQPVYAASVTDGTTPGATFMLGGYSPAAAAGTAMLAQQQGVTLRSPAAQPQQQQLQQQQQYLLATGPIMQQQQQQYGRPGSGARAAAPAESMGAVVQMSMQLSAAQMSLITGQLYNIASMSGAEINTVPVAGGLYYMNLMGGQSQVEAARQLVSSVLSQMPGMM